jgi:hypothetical protein
MDRMDLLLYWSTSSSIRINGEGGESFKLVRSVKQGCPLAPYFFILATDVLGHLLDNPKYGVKGLTLSKGDCIRGQTYADNTMFYLMGTPNNMDRAREVLDLFCSASEAKINWKKSTAIWAIKNTRSWEWGGHLGLKWIPKGKGIRYVGIQVGFRLPMETNFDKLMYSLKGKLITWGHRNLSLADRTIVPN